MTAAPTQPLRSLAALPPARSLAYIEGAFVPAVDGATFDSLDPATGLVISEVAACGPADVDVAVRSARRAFDSGSWSRASPADRKRVLLAFATLIEEHAEELALLEAVDAGKPIRDCREFDLPDVLGTIRWYAETADKVFGKTAPTDEDHLGLVVREPVGVVGAVLPWNFPMAMLAWKIAPALSVGNSVVVKPPELAPLTTLRLAELASQAGLPPGVLNVVPGLGEVAGQALGRHDDVDMMTFTGSTEVGRMFLRYSADSNLKNVVLECGGKCPQIVMADCREELDVIAADLAGAAFWNAGQNCSAGSRILVQRDLRDDFVAALARAAQTWTVGPPTDDSTRLGPLIEAAALDRVLSHVELARAAGARVVTGGRRVLSETGGWFVGPTIVDEVTPEMVIAQEEIFGPVVAVLAFDDAEEALRLANRTPYGLAATVWCRDIDVALRTARGIRAGTVAVNGYSEGDISTPFGGYRMSGFGGRDNGLEALQQYTELKTIWISLR